MALTRLQNIISSVEGRIIYVNPDDFDSTDANDNKGNSPLRPFRTIARAVYEIVRYSYVSAGKADDKFDQFTIMLYPGDHIVDNRPASYLYKLDGSNNVVVNLDETFSASPIIGNYGWSDTKKEYSELYNITNSIRGGLIIPRGTSIIGIDLRKTKIRPKYIPSQGADSSATYKNPVIDFDVTATNKTQLTVNSVNGGLASSTAGGSFVGINDLYIGAFFEQGIKDVSGNNLIDPGTAITSINYSSGQPTDPVVINISKPHNYTADQTSVNATLSYPYVDDNSRSSLFKITGGCYFWQFSVFDGDPTGVFTSSIVTPRNTWSKVSPSSLSHSKLTVFEFASLNELETLYRKVAFSDTSINTNFIETRIQENRIVGPLSDNVEITKVSRLDEFVTVELSQELNLTTGNFVNISGNITGNSAINSIYIGEKKVTSVPNRSSFVFSLSASDTSSLLSSEGQDNQIYTNPTAEVEVEIDTVESASPYIFNISMRSTFGMCGMHADGARATGFKSMVVAQYTGISLQKLDSAFVKYNSGTGQYQAGSGTDTLHTDGDAIYSPLERSYHVKASNRAVIQAVSVFAVGFADHFIAESGGDLSITNSNSNFGSNAIRSIGFSEKSFSKDSFGRITHIIPPKNVSSTESNYYWETFNAILTKTQNNRLYLAGRTAEVGITNGGTGFTSATGVNVFKDGSQVLGGVQCTTTASNGIIQTITFANSSYGNLQPGDVLTIPAASGSGDVDCTFVFGDTLTTKVGSYTIGAKNLNTDGTSADEVITVPLFATANATVQTNQTAIVNTTGNIFDYDHSNTNWYINVNSGPTNQIFTALGSTKYGSGSIETTPTSFLKRINDERIDDDKIYRLRYETTSGPGGVDTDPPSFPQTGYVIQPKKGLNILGVGDRYTDASNLLLLNKEIISNEAITRYNNANIGSPVANDDIAECKDDLISIIETIAHDIRYGGTLKTVAGADLYTGSLGSFETQRSATAEIINSVGATDTASAYDANLDNDFRGLKWMMENIINNGGGTSNGITVTAKPYGSILSGVSPKYIDQTQEEQLTNTAGGCANVISAANTLVDIYITAIGTDSNPGTVPTAQSFTAGAPTETFDGVVRNVYERISGHDYNDVYYVYEVEEVVPYDKTTDLGVYYLTVVKGSVGVSNAVLANNTYKLSQNIDSLYPEIDIDNIISDPIISRSVADFITIGKVKTTDGRSTSTVEDDSFSITKESISTFLDEYLNNELEWLWNGKETASTLVTNDVYPNSNGSVGATTVTLQSGNGNAESRKIPINPASEVSSFDVELRRPSTIRSGNHTFEYVGFGPGNYSTAFPIRQKKILSDDEQKYAQSLKEAGGIAFYSGLNSNGDLYIGNTVINAVTGKTTENEINELKSLTIIDSFNVIGGSSNTIATNFQSPVNFTNDILGDGGNYIFSNIQLRDPSGFTSKLTAVTGVPVDANSSQGDFAFNLDATNGSHIGNVKTDQSWRPSGLIGVERIHSYKNGSDFTLNVGSDLQSDLSSQTVVNLNYDLDVTTRQRIGSHLDIGNASNAAIDSNSATKQTRLQIKDTLDTNITTSNTIELVKSGFNTEHNFIKCEDSLNTELFTVDTDGNVNIPTTSKYGNADKAWSLTLTVASTGNSANNLCTITPLGTGFYSGSDSVPKFDGTSPNGNQTIETNGYLSGFIYKVTESLTSFKYVGTPGQLTQFLSNPNSVLVFVNGVLQDPYLDYTFDGSNIIFSGDVSPENGDRITIRGLAT